MQNSNQNVLGKMLTIENFYINRKKDHDKSITRGNDKSMTKSIRICDSNYRYSRIILISIAKLALNGNQKLIYVPNLQSFFAISGIS